MSSSTSQLNQKFQSAKMFINAADSLLPSLNKVNEVGRAILYLSSLSCELSLKAVLECAGYTSQELKIFSHKLATLLEQVGYCKIVSTGRRATVLRAKQVSKKPIATVGLLLEAERLGSSVYPNQIRYDDTIRHYPPDVMLNCARVVSDWCIQHRNDLIR